MHHICYNNETKWKQLSVHGECAEGNDGFSKGVWTLRLTFGIILFVLAGVMAVCSEIARKKGKKIGNAAAMMLICTIPPVAGNAVIILSSQRILSLIGCYTYYLGMDLIIAAMLHFTFVYCRMEWPNKMIRNALYSLFLIDVIQLLLNIVFHHAFEVQAMEVYGYDYYKMIPHLGQHFHRVVDYCMLAGIIGIFINRLVKSPRLQSERYSVILGCLIVVTVWESAYIISGTPMDRSMVGFAVFSLMIFYFSLYYRPMRLLDRMLGSVVAQQQQSMFFFDANQRCLWMNPAGQKLLGLKEEETARAGGELEKMFGSRHVGEDEWSEQVITPGDEGGERTCELSRSPFRDKKGKINGFYITVRDETEERRQMARKLYNARHDHLTGLYNGDYLFERTRELLDKNPEKEYLLIYADINDFKMINDVYGYAFGDYALQVTAKWVEEDLSDNSVCGRLGGDTFGVCLPAEEFNQERAEQKLSDFVVNDGTTEHHLLIHIGVYRVAERDIPVSVMYDRAHMALDTVKEEYHVITGWYEDSLRDQVLWNQQISAELPEAIAEGQIRPWLQPIMDRNGKAIGAEALVRWVHPEDGIRNPGSFIPVFEQNGMIADLDLHIWKSSCEILARWQQEGNDLFISVNISPKDFIFLDVGAELKRLVKEYGIDPRKLRVEITETVMMSDMEKRMAVLEDLRQSGFLIEMDDFGSGYSSLNMLKDMPVDVVKIDMAFRGRSNQASIPRAKAIVREIIALARALDIVSLTEGVETEEQYHNLMAMGCELYQGYYFSKPIPLDQFEEHFCSAD